MAQDKNIEERTESILYAHGVRNSGAVSQEMVEHFTEERRSGGFVPDDLKSQTDCRDAFMIAARSFLAEVDKIDAATPWSNSEPRWWLEMAAMRRDILQKLEALEGGEA